jgi:hypothetical protein
MNYKYFFLYFISNIEFSNYAQIKIFIDFENLKVYVYCIKKNIVKAAFVIIIVDKILFNLKILIKLNCYII